jgi:hypothetical protein
MEIELSVRLTGSSDLVVDYVHPDTKLQLIQLESLAAQFISLAYHPESRRVDLHEGTSKNCYILNK